MAQDKNRKSEAQKVFEEADNAGRFSGEDSDSKAAREQAIENIRQDTESTAQDRNKDSDNAGGGDDDTVELQANDGDAQNIRDEATDTLGENTDHSRNKAMEGQRQNRDTGSSGTNS